MRVPVIALCVLALAGCRDAGGNTTLTRAELPSCVLQSGDFGKGWVQFDEGRQVRLDAQPGPRADPARFGRAEGWKARYRRVTGKLGAPSVVISRADLFDGSGGAQKDLDAYRSELDAEIPGSGATTRLLEAPQLGDGTVAAELRQGPLVIFTVAWRRSNATASVAVQGRTGATSLRDALVLARAQDRHLALAARN